MISSIHPNSALRNAKSRKSGKENMSSFPRAARRMDTAPTPGPPSGSPIWQICCGKRRTIDASSTKTKSWEEPVLGFDATLCERPDQIGVQIFHVFYSDGQAQQIGRAGRARPLHRGAMFDQTFYAAKRGRA